MVTGPSTGRRAISDAFGVWLSAHDADVFASEKSGQVAGIAGEHHGVAVGDGQRSDYSVCRRDRPAPWNCRPKAGLLRGCSPPGLGGAGCGGAARPESRAASGHWSTPRVHSCPQVRSRHDTGTDLAKATRTELVAHYLDPNLRTASGQPCAERHRDEEAPLLQPLCPRRSTSPAGASRATTSHPPQSRWWSQRAPSGHAVSSTRRPGRRATRPSDRCRARWTPRARRRCLAGRTSPPTTGRTRRRPRSARGRRCRPVRRGCRRPFR